MQMKPKNAKCYYSTKDQTTNALDELYSKLTTHLLEKSPSILGTYKKSSNGYIPV